MRKKTCVIIGANSEIGNFIAKKMASQYQLLLVWHNSRDRIDNSRCCFENADIVQKEMTDERAVESLLKYAFDKYGTIDCVINCIGKNIRQTDDSITAKDWDDVLNNNLKPVLYICRYYGKYLQGEETGCIINFSSTAGVRGIAKSPHYVVAKAGVIALSEYYAKVLAPRIRVNSIAPGFVETDAHTSSSYDYIRESTPMKRMASMSEIYSTVNYLIECNFITGQTIIVDGGLIL